MSNHLTLTGNVVREPQLGFTASGNARLAMPVATNRRFQAKGSETPTEVVSFFTVIVWGQLAEHVAETISKGDRVTVTGRVEQRTWTDEHEQRHQSFEIVADDVAASLRFRTAKIDRTTRIVAPTGETTGGEITAARTTGEESTVEESTVEESTVEESTVEEYTVEAGFEESSFEGTSGEESSTELAVAEEFAVAV
jgi:single-strand DNA-binding protein